MSTGGGVAAGDSIEEVLDAQAQSQLQTCKRCCADGAMGLVQLRRIVLAAQGARWIRCIPLNDAVMTDSLSTLRYLVDHVKVETLNIKSTARDTNSSQGYYPLQIAVIFGKLEIMVYLLSRGADPMLKEESSAVKMARLRQQRLEEAHERAEDGAQFEQFSITKSQIEPLIAEGLAMLEVLEGIESHGSYQDWAKANCFHRLVKRFSRDIRSVEPRYQFVLIRALVMADRASLLPLAERAAMEAQEAAEAATQAKEQQSLFEALVDAGFSGEVAKTLKDSFKLPTVKALRDSRISSDDIEKRLEPKVRAGYLKEGERRRFARWVRELDETVPAYVPAKAASAAGKGGGKATAKTKAKGPAPAAKAALLALAANSAGRGSSAKAPPAAKPKQGSSRDGMSLLFCMDLPGNVFMVVVRFLVGI